MYMNQSKRGLTNMTDCKHEFLKQPDGGVTRCFHCSTVQDSTPLRRACDFCGRFVITHNTSSDPYFCTVECTKRAQLVNRVTHAETSHGLKHDSDKPDMSLFPRGAIEAGARAFMFGEKKYSRNNWRNGISKERLMAATLRHLFAWNDGELKDPESGLSHLDHAQASLAMLITLHNKE